MSDRAGGGVKKLDVDTARPTAASAQIEGVIKLRDVEGAYRSGLASSQPFYRQKPKDLTVLSSTAPRTPVS